MELVNPGIGLIFWMTVAFLAILFILGKYAWRPIMKALKEREVTIHRSLNEAEKARKEMEKLRFSNEMLLQEAKNDRDIILNEARKLKEKIIEEAKLKAGEEANRILAAARESIENEKMGAMTELKNQLAFLSLEVAEKILKRELSDAGKQEDYIKNLLKEVKFN
jgi:F-type H+-transporting ATPase subunit b